MRRLAAAALVLAGCAAPPADPRHGTPRPIDAGTLSVLEPRDGACVWERIDAPVEPPFAPTVTEIARLPGACGEGHQATWSPDGRSGLFTDGENAVWVTFGDGRVTRLPPLEVVADTAFDPEGYPAVEATRATALTRIRHWLGREEETIETLRFDGRRWQPWDETGMQQPFLIQYCALLDSPKVVDEKDVALARQGHPDAPETARVRIPFLLFSEDDLSSPQLMVMTDPPSVVWSSHDARLSTFWPKPREP